MDILIPLSLEISVREKSRRRKEGHCKKAYKCCLMFEYSLIVVFKDYPSQHKYFVWTTEKSRNNTYK